MSGKIVNVAGFILKRVPSQVEKKDKCFCALMLTLFKLGSTVTAGNVPETQKAARCPCQRRSGIEIHDKV